MVLEVESLSTGGVRLSGLTTLIHTGCQHCLQEGQLLELLRHLSLQ